VKHYVFVVVAGLAWLGGAKLASAGAPAWCGSAKFEANSSDVRSAASNDPGQAIAAIATALCAGGADVEPHRAEIEAARVAWSKKLAMQDADWVDAVAFASDRSHALRRTCPRRGWRR